VASSYDVSNTVRARTVSFDLRDDRVMLELATSPKPGEFAESRPLRPRNLDKESNRLGKENVDLEFRFTDSDNCIVDIENRQLAQRKELSTLTCEMQQLKWQLQMQEKLREQAESQRDEVSCALRSRDAMVTHLERDLCLRDERVSSLHEHVQALNSKLAETQSRSSTEAAELCRQLDESRAELSVVLKQLAAMRAAPADMPAEASESGRRHDQSQSELSRGQMQMAEMRAAHVDDQASLELEISQRGEEISRLRSSSDQQAQHILQLTEENEASTREIDVAQAALERASRQHEDVERRMQQRFEEVQAQVLEFQQGEALGFAKRLVVIDSRARRAEVDLETALKDVELRRTPAGQVAVSSVGRLSCRRRRETSSPESDAAHVDLESERLDESKCELQTLRDERKQLRAERSAMLECLCLSEADLERILADHVEHLTHTN